MGQAAFSRELRGRPQTADSYRMALAAIALRPPSPDARKLQRKQAVAMQKEISDCVAEMFIKGLHICHREGDKNSYPQTSTGLVSVYVLEIIVQRSPSGISRAINAAIKKRPSAFSWRAFQLGLRPREESSGWLMLGAPIPSGTVAPL